MSAPFNIRIRDDVLAGLKDLAAECKVHTSVVINWACEAYVELCKANGGRMLTTSELNEVIALIKAKAVQANTIAFPRDQVSELKAAEEPHEPGKIINPAAAGGADTALGKTYRQVKRRK